MSEHNNLTENRYYEKKSKYTVRVMQIYHQQMFIEHLSCSRSIRRSSERKSKAISSPCPLSAPLPQCGESEHLAEQRAMVLCRESRQGRGGEREEQCICEGSRWEGLAAPYFSKDQEGDRASDCRVPSALVSFSNSREAGGTMALEVGLEMRSQCMWAASGASGRILAFNHVRWEKLGGSAEHRLGLGRQ